MNDADIRRWYHENKVPYLEEDWGPRGETGESIGPQSQVRERTDTTITAPTTPDHMWWWEKQHFPWHRRSVSEKEWLRMLEDFFTPYLATMPRAKGNLLMQLYADLSTYAEIGERERIARQSAFEATRRALRDLTRRIAEDDPEFVPPEDGRRRDYEAELVSARRVLARYIDRKRDE